MLRATRASSKCLFRLNLHTHYTVTFSCWHNYRIQGQFSWYILVGPWIRTGIKPLKQKQQKSKLHLTRPKVLTLKKKKHQYCRSLCSTLFIFTSVIANVTFAVESSETDTKTWPHLLNAHHFTRPEWSWNSWLNLQEDFSKIYVKNVFCKWDHEKRLLKNYYKYSTHKLFSWRGNST